MPIYFHLAGNQNNLAFREVADTCLPEGSREGVPSSALLVHVAFALPCEQFLPQPMSSPTFTFLILSHSYLGRASEQPCSADLLNGAILHKYVSTEYMAVELKRSCHNQNLAGIYGLRNLKGLMR